MCKHLGQVMQVMKGHVIEIHVQTQHTPYGMNEAKRDFFLCIHSRLGQIFRVIYRQWKIIRCISQQDRHFKEMSCISLKYPVSFFWTGKEPRVTSSKGCFRSNGAELFIFTLCFAMTLHKNGQYPFCKWEIGRRERWRYLSMLPRQDRNKFSALFPIHSARVQ